MKPQYPNLGLYRNPFEISAERDIRNINEIIEDVKRFCLEIREVEYGKIRKRFLQPLLRPTEGRICENLWIKGEKGVGKSILLKKLAFDLYGKPDIVTLYIKVPVGGLDLTGIYQRSVEWLGTETFSKLALTIYDTYFRKLSLNDAARILKVPSEELQQFTREIKKLVRKDPQLIFSFFSKNPSSIKELQKLGIPRGSIKLGSLSYQVSARLVAEEHISKNFSDLIAYYPENPEEAFMKIQNVSGKQTVPMLLSFHRAASAFLKTRCIVIVLDEFEIAWRKMTDAGRMSTVVAIRAFHDASQGNIKFIVTVTDDVFDVLPFDKYRHILDVIPKTTTGTNVVDVSKVDSSQAIKLVEFLLSQEGIRARPAKFIHPFVPEVVSAVNKKVGGVTRDLVVEMRHIIEEAEEKGKKIIDKDALIEISEGYKPYLE